MMASRSFCGMSPCMADTVKLFCRIFSVSQSTFRLVLQKMTACGVRSGRDVRSWQLRGDFQRQAAAVMCAAVAPALSSKLVLHSSPHRHRNAK